MASTTSGAPRLSPLVATSTGSSTTGAARWAISRSATRVATVPSASMPSLTASTRISAKIASIWAARNPGGGTCTAVTPRVFWAVRAVSTAMP